MANQVSSDATLVLIQALKADLDDMAQQWMWLNNISHLEKTRSNGERDRRKGALAVAGHADPVGDIVGSMERVRHQMKVFDRELRRAVMGFSRRLEVPYRALHKAQRLIDSTYERSDNRLENSSLEDDEVELNRLRAAKRRREERGEGWGVG